MKRCRKRLFLSAVFAALIPLGYYLRFRAPIPAGARDSSGGALYVILFVVLGAIVFADSAPFRIAFVVVVATCVLEFLQLWHPRWLEVLRATWPGRVLLGTTFGWNDFPPYFAGGFAGWLLLRTIGARDH